MFETQLDEICLFPLQNKKKSFTFDDKKADEVKKFGRPRGELGSAHRGLRTKGERPKVFWGSPTSDSPNCAEVHEFDYGRKTF